MSFLRNLLRNKQAIQLLNNGSAMFNGNVTRGLHTGLQTLQQSHPTYAAPQSRPRNFQRPRQMQNVNTDYHKDIMDSEQLSYLLNRYIKKGSMTSSEALFILRSCGDSLVFASVTKRQELTTSIWEFINKCNVALDVSHFNSLLQAYIDNKTDINYIEIIQLMKDKNVKPNRITYAKFINHFCQSGDTEGANKILEIMNEENLPIDENIFNSLIIGNGRANDQEGALQVLDIMKQKLMVIGRSTIDSLLIMYSELNKLPEAMKTIKDAEQDKIAISSKALFDAYVNFKLHKNADAVDQISAHLPSSQKVTVMIGALEKLIAAEEYDCALHLFGLASVSPKLSGYLLQLLSDKAPSSILVKFCKMLSSFQLKNSAPFSKCSEKLLRAIGQFKLDDLSTLNVLNSGVMVNDEAIASFISNLDAKSSSVTDDIIKLLYLDSMKGTKLYFTAFKFLDMSDPMKVLEYLNKKLPFNRNRYTAFLGYCLQNDRIHDALNIAIPYGRHCNNSHLLHNKIWEYILLHKDQMDECAKLTTILGINTSYIIAIGEMLAENDLSGQHFLEYLKALEKLGVKYMTSELQNLKANSFCSSEEIQSVLTNLENVESPSPELLELRHKVSDAVKLAFECEREKEIKFFDRIRQDDSLDRIIQQYKAICSPYSEKKNITVDLKMGDVYYKHRKVEEAYTLFKGIYGIFTNVKPGFTTASYVQVLLELKKFNELQEFLTKMPPFPTYQRLSDRNLMVLGTMPNDSTKSSLLDTLKERNTLNDDTIKIVDIYNHISRNNLTEAMELMKTYPVKGHQVNEFYKQCIKTEEPQKMQAFHDYLITKIGKVLAIHQLGIAFLEMKKLKQAQHLFQSLGSELHPKFFARFANLYCNEDKLEEMENLVKVSQDLAPQKRADIYEKVILLHMNRNSIQPALEVWVDMQDENLQLSDGFAASFAKFLTNNGVEVPFATSYSNSSPKINREPVVRPFRNKIHSLLSHPQMENLCDDPEDLKQFLVTGTENVDVQVINTFLKKMLTGVNGLKIFELLKTEDLFIYPEQLSVMFQTYSERNELGAFVEKILACPVENVRPQSEYVEILTTCMAADPNCVEIVEKASNVNDKMTDIVLWNWYMIEDRKEDADQIFQKCKSHPNFTVSSHLAVKCFDEGSLPSLNEYVSQLRFSQRLVPFHILCSVVNALIDRSKSQEAVKYLNDNSEILLTANRLQRLWLRTLLRKHEINFFIRE